MFFFSVSFTCSVFYTYQFDSTFCMNFECNITFFSRYCFISINLRRTILYYSDKNANIKCPKLLRLGEELYINNMLPFLSCLFLCNNVYICCLVNLWKNVFKLNKSFFSVNIISMLYTHQRKKRESLFLLN